VRIILGDLLKLAKEGTFDVIVHGCNCFCTMGRGIALSMKNQFPEAAEVDKRTVRGDVRKLGTCTQAEVKRGVVSFTVVNAYTQYHWEGIGVLADYEAIRNCMLWIRKHHSGKRLGFPKIGAGLARGDWSRIQSIMDDILAGEDVTVVDFVPDWKTKTPHIQSDRVLVYGELFTCLVDHTSDVFGNDYFDKRYWHRHGE